MADAVDAVHLQRGGLPGRLVERGGESAGGGWGRVGRGGEDRRCVWGCGDDGVWDFRRGELGVV